MIPDFSGDFLNFQSTKDGDVITILDEGKVEFNKALKKEMFNISVKRGEKVMTYSPSMNMGRLLQDELGEDSKDWVGKTFNIVHVDGKLYIKPNK